MLTSISNFGGNVVGWTVEQTGDSLSLLGLAVKNVSFLALLGLSTGTAATIIMRDPANDGQEGFFSGFVWKFFDLPQLLSAGGIVTGSLVDETGRKVQALGGCLRDPERSVFKSC